MQALARPRAGPNQPRHNARPRSAPFVSSIVKAVRNGLSDFMTEEGAALHLWRFNLTPGFTKAPCTLLNMCWNASTTRISSKSLTDIVGRAIELLLLLCVLRHRAEPASDMRPVQGSAQPRKLIISLTRRHPTPVALLRSATDTAPATDWKKKLHKLDTPAAQRKRGGASCRSSKVALATEYALSRDATGKFVVSDDRLSTNEGVHMRMNPLMEATGVFEYIRRIISAILESSNKTGAEVQAAGNFGEVASCRAVPARVCWCEDVPGWQTHTCAAASRPLSPAPQICSDSAGSGTKQYDRQAPLQRHRATQGGPLQPVPGRL